MDEFPTAFFLAPLEDVINNPYVLFRLVTPTPPNSFQKRGGVESAAGLVNVIPQRRIYRMETIEEIEIFKRELIKRPLVLQCMSHSGVGCGSVGLGCGILPNDKNWVLLINQTYPKVLSRIQMGCDAAKNAMDKGHPFVLRFQFGTLLQRLHMELFPEEEMRFPILQYVEWEFAEIVIRFPGGLGSEEEEPPTTFLSPVCTELNFDFADINQNEIKRVSNPQNKVLRGQIPAITEEEIRDVLHGWTINEISPLDDIGEERPETYNYAQAGRLYESFRRKKRRQPKASDSSQGAGEKPDDRVRMHSATSVQDDSIDIREVETSFVVDDGGFSPARRNLPSDTRQPVRPQRRGDNYQPRLQEKRGQGYGNGHLYPNITVVDNNRGRTSSSDSYYNNMNSGPDVPKPFDQIPHRDSDRSSHSTGGADSGYSGADDDGFSGYYGNRRQDDHRKPANDYMRERDGHHYDPIDKYGSTTTQRAHENLGFRLDDNDGIIRKHKELASKSKPSRGYDYDGGSQSRHVYERPNEQYEERRDYARLSRPQNRHYNDSGDNRRDYYEPRDRSRGYSSERTPTSYNSSAAPEAGSKLRLPEQEAMAESFI